MHRESRGFTLLEVLVAVSIFAIAALALLNAQRTQITTDQHLEEKTFAHWVAMNHLTEMRLDGAFPEIGQRESTAHMAGRDWLITTKAQGTPTPNVRLITISVGLKTEQSGTGSLEEKTDPVSVLTAFLPRRQSRSENAPSS